jgi:hypothetical protein
MSFIRSTLAVVVLACTEPTAILQRPASSVATHESVATSSFSLRGADRTIYVRLVSPREGVEPAHSFMRRMFSAADSARSRRMVVDLRAVTGGDARMLVPLIRGIVARGRFAESGGLYVVVGEQSYSPSQSAATLLGRYARPLYVSDVPSR